MPTATVRSRSAPAARAQVPRATRGPFSVTFQGFDVDRWMYKIQVHGSDGEHTIFRRYNHFSNLRACLSASGLHDGAELPPLPPKSFFRKNFSEKFMLQRAACLRSLLQAVLEVDGFVSTKAHAEFLAIGKVSSWQQGRQSQSMSLSGVLESSDDETEEDEEEEEKEVEGYPSPVFLADADCSADIPFGDQKFGLSEGAGPEAPVKMPVRRARSRMQRVRAKLLLAHN